MHLEAFEPYAQLTLLENVEKPIKVPLEEALKFACNATVLDRDVVVPKGCPQTVKALTQNGFQVHELDFSEFIKAGGAAKCLVLKLK